MADRIPNGCRAIGVIDGVDAARPVEFALSVRDLVGASGRHCDVIDLHDYVRPASLRFEYSRTDESTYRTAWFDFAAVEREIVAPMRAGGRGTFLPRLWDESADRSARASLVDAAPDHVLLIAGPMTLGRIPDVAVTVHLKISEATMRRRTPEADAWTVAPLLEFYAGAPTADVVVRWDHPNRPAILQA
ncbi:hypothetical protein CH293_24170 [Rhodococcus sp. 14-2470-1b]|uniref:hypothetical protein n=1 Tax=Rhodococcus sp. 14-2470-1b TaxID=2023149 RepID=UPI000B9C1206|nr:hypothetical protein [Rhodococcus sp. 14-2470-1b]OZF44127.1 hypothetical protein CH293_24170 [Rhodococcus sp. 14-2470-1b]